MKTPWLCLLSLLLTLLSVPQAFAFAYPSLGDSFGISPYLDYKTIYTEHFRISFPAELEPIAVKSAAYYEEAHRILSKQLFWEPTKIVNVVILDNADAANGLTSPIQRLGMVLYVTPPDNWFSTNYYDDWLRVLIFHEYTHFLNMDVTRGVFSVLRFVTGDLLLPNSLWPGWMLEGYAVYNETRYTRAGRGRSPYYEMVLRTAVHEGVLDSPKYVTLDRLNLDYPYHPAGEIPYLFGYQMMNQVALETKPGLTHDEVDTVKTGEEVLGLMSWRSGGRIPYLINGNLDNLTGQDWYDKWNHWVAQTRERMTKDIATIQKEPLTGVKPITTGAFNASGATVSPDGKWLAYFLDSYDERRKVSVINRVSGDEFLTFESRLGSKLSFSTDSKKIYFSGLVRKSSYYAWSELGVYEIETKKLRYLTDGARARDPNISPDGRRIAFTQTRDTRTSLAWAPLVDEGDFSDIQVGTIEVLHTPKELGRVSTPVWSKDGKKIVFSLKENGEVGEDIAEYDVENKKVSLLLHNGAFNRYPFYLEDGRLIYLSDFTGVDNLYQYNGEKDPIQRTNVITGLTFPTSGRDGSVYASQFTHRGWSLVQFKLSEKPVNDTAVTVAEHPGPAIDELSTSQAAPVAAQSEEYSAWSSLGPRQWFPFLSWTSEGRGYFGGQFSGFDMLDKHRYFFAGAWDNGVRRVDGLFIYSNRSFGPNITLLGYEQTQDTRYLSREPIAYTRKRSLELNAYYPFQFTWSQLIPEVALNLERNAYFAPRLNGREPIAKSRYVPSADALLTFANPRAARLSIAPDVGRRITLGGRRYFDPDVENLKYLALYTEFFRLDKDFHIQPTLKYSGVDKRNNRFLDANVKVEGAQARILNPLGGDSLDALSIRGYPNHTFYARSVGQAVIDTKFPLSRIYRGWGTNPAWLNYVYGVAFIEDTIFMRSTTHYHLPAAGGGLKLTGSVLLHTDFTFGVEYHHGINEDFGGKGEALVSLGLSAGVF